VPEPLLAPPPRLAATYFRVLEDITPIDAAWDRRILAVDPRHPVARRNLFMQSLSQEGAEEFLDRYLELLRLVGAGYRREGKRYLTVAVGCTGGKHRSVAMTVEIARRLAERGHHVRATHRDLGRE